jgi:hypothetical protein
MKERRLDSLEAIDAMARAAHLWVRHLKPATRGLDDTAHAAFVAGLIAGLCEELGETPAAAGWVGYVYALLDGYGSDALGQSARLASPDDIRHLPEYPQGRAEAGHVLAWLQRPA